MLETDPKETLWRPNRPFPSFRSSGTGERQICVIQKRRETDFDSTKLKKVVYPPF